MSRSTIRRGTYVLLLTLGSGLSADIGSLGHVELPPGDYCYVGSAMGGLEQRLDRHLSKEKNIRWHIDRMTLVADSMSAYVSYPDPIPECDLGSMAVDSGCVPVCKGFGCSDCGCMTHLFQVPSGAMSLLVKSAGLDRYARCYPA